METQQSSTQGNLQAEPCCEEQKFWTGFLHQWKSAVRWILFGTAVIVIGLFVLGLTIDPSVTRILWLSFTGLILVVILPVLVFVWKWIDQGDEKCRKEKNNY